MPIDLRLYQQTAINEVRRLIVHGKRRVLLCLPTGGGKTLTSGAIIAGAVAKGSRVLFVAHRKELIDQAATALYRLGVHPVGIIRAGDKRRNLALPVQVASIQTLSRRKLLDPPPQIIIIDECHRALAKGYQDHLYSAYPNAIIIGLSATPCRADGKPLSGAFEHIIPAATYSELILGGFIDTPRVYSTPMAPDLSGVHTAGGDYDREELEAAVNRSALIGNIGAEWQRRAEGRRTVVFCVSVAHSLAVVEMFRGLGVKAEHLDGTTPEMERAKILGRLDRGETQLVSNVGVLCEGWDCPPVKCLAIARPTKSLSLWMQMAGRILRPWGDVEPVILDHGGNVDRHGLPHMDRTWSLEGKQKRDKAAEPPMKVCADCFAYIPAGSKACPYCGVVAPPKEREAPKELPEVELVLRTLEGDEDKIAFWRKQVRMAKDRGWKPGAVMHKYRERFGVDAPREWWLDVKRAAGRDAEWKERIEKRKGASDEWAA
jgi:DNA repair protein RadD